MEADQKVSGTKGLVSLTHKDDTTLGFPGHH